jgi:steroid 5-alpha reductase family enzyme
MTRALLLLLLLIWCCISNILVVDLVGVVVVSGKTFRFNDWKFYPQRKERQNHHHHHPRVPSHDLFHPPNVAPVVHDPIHCPNEQHSQNHHHQPACSSSSSSSSTEEGRVVHPTFYSLIGGAVVNNEDTDDTDTGWNNAIHERPSPPEYDRHDIFNPLQHPNAAETATAFVSRNSGSYHNDIVAQDLIQDLLTPPPTLQQPYQRSYTSWTRQATDVAKEQYQMDHRLLLRNDHHHPHVVPSTTTTTTTTDATATTSVVPPPPDGSSSHRFIGSFLVRAFGSVLITTLLGTTTTHAHTATDRQVYGNLISFPTLYACALVGSSVGFYLYLYFISIGHALGIFLPVLVTLVRYYHRIHVLSLSVSVSAVIHSILVLFWSIRLCVFLLWREYYNWPALHNKIRRVQVDLQQKFICWFLYSFLSVAMLAPCWFRLQCDIVQQLTTTTAATTSSSSRISIRTLPRIATVLGISFQVIGLVVESIADYQKSTFKSLQRNQWCHVGLWKWSTHPNYAGEWVFWLGTILAAIPTLLVRHPTHNNIMIRFVHGTIMMIGFYFLSIILHGASQKLDQKQRTKYGTTHPLFLDFVTTTGIFGPKRYHVTFNQNWWRRNVLFDSTKTTEDILDSTLAATEEIYR